MDRKAEDRERKRLAHGHKKTINKASLKVNVAMLWQRLLDHMMPIMEPWMWKGTTFDCGYLYCYLNTIGTAACSILCTLHCSSIWNYEPCILLADSFL